MPLHTHFRTTLVLTAFALVCAPAVHAQDSAWTPLFNGRDLEGWIPKIRGHAAGEDPYGTFRVEDGLLTIGYERYGPTFEDRFGHLFYETPFSEYVLRVEYRFIGEQLPDGPGWAFRNSGVMLHGQSPFTMPPEQDFPISIEAQFLGGRDEGERPTANLCTPGTNVTRDGELFTPHCLSSTSKTVRGDTWVTVDLIVEGARRITHVLDGDTVMVYENPQIGGGQVSGHDPVVKTDGRPLDRGYLALQSESHPIQFRSVLIRRLDGAWR